MPRSRAAGRPGPALVATCLGVLVLAPALLLALPRTRDVVVIGAPGRTPREMADLVARADGRLVASTGTGNALVATSDRPGFPLRLYAAGAWLVLASAGPAGCGPAARPATALP
ncbi:hypothetical protein [Methylobacterium oryzihabitans]|uniref:Uncharacterized protein n=1 Tax=Methylobacterium oryzihabitans TaxID=2499852 RepID=A0A3S3UBJ8_9HYPH|nr:hypothetical protein [Methylobacterium oryzihabitans]RVU20140.1 hypothetical protein EOE48_05880 [Methylobacterium oryzihabitans]